MQQICCGGEMYELLWIIPALPFAGFLVLALGGRRLSRRLQSAVGVGSIGLAAALTIIIGIRFLTSPPVGDAFSLHLWTWWDVGGMRPGITLYLDPLSLVFMFVVTFVGFLIHLYSTEYMADDPARGRFLSYMNLFVGAMLMLVLGDNLMLLYLGWEGVGLCSYLLIGFWYQDPANGRAARKAFVVTRIGDTAMAIGLFFLFWHFGTTQIQDLMGAAAAQWSGHPEIATIAALLLLGGAIGKSAQLPLQTWLPDAMAGPTPVSALIHAATMVTAGVYLIARTNVLFSLSPVAMTAVAVIGALTLLIAGVSAIVQSDIKRVLAYSTISQIGYMFLALGVGAWSAAVFHFMTHAFFKALLFLGAGAVIVALHHEQNIFKMGGLRKLLPTTFWCFLIGCASLAAVPLISSGFFSKDLILWEAWSSPLGNRWLWAAGMLGAMMTTIYTFRMVFIVFYGKAKTQVTHRPGKAILVPLIVLAVLATLSGYLEIPATLGNVPLFSEFMAPSFGTHSTPAHGEIAAGHGVNHADELPLQILAGCVCLIGIYVSYFLFRKRSDLPKRWHDSAIGGALHRFMIGGCGFDTLYQALVVTPYCRLAEINKPDYFDLINIGLASLTASGHRVLARFQTGRLRSYAIGIVTGAIIAVAMMVWL
jgi:NADH-quinone oxidoreductase subunit L